MKVRNLICGVLLSVALATTAHAQAEFISLEGDEPITLSPYRPDANSYDHRLLSSSEPTPLVHRSVVIELPRYSHLPSDGGQGFVTQVTPTYIPSGSLVIRYEGFHRFAAKRMQSRFRSIWRKQIRQIYNDSFIDPLELGRIQTDLADAWADTATVGRWWDRTWEDSLPADKGGAPAQAYVHTVGQDITILELGPLKIKNTLKARIDKVAFSLDDSDAGRIYRSIRHAEDRTARDDARLERHVLDPEDDEAEPEEDEKLGQPSWEPITRLAIDFQPLERHLWEGVSWSFKLRPSIRLSASLDYMQVVRELSLKGELDILWGARRDKVVELEVELEYQPESNELEFTVEVALLTW